MAVSNIKSNPTSGVAASEASKAEKSVKTAKAASAYAKNAAPTPPAEQEAANVQISPRARELSMAKKIANESPDIREDKIAELKAKIAQGEYKPDANKIAEGIAREAIRDELASHSDELF